MPELPEVETIARALESGGRSGVSIVGKQIHTIYLEWEKSLVEPQPGVFKSLMAGQLIKQVGRRGKFLVIRLSEDSLIIHLRMSGDLRVDGPSHGTSETESPLKHDRFWAVFEDGYRLVFNDPRKFGRIWLLRDPQSFFSRLGPEPFDPVLTVDTFHGQLLKFQRQIKPLMLDQSFLAGMGNIYTDEALHQARIHPKTLSSQLNVRQAENLLSAIRAVLSEGILRNGASIDWVYRGGSFQNNFRVYQQTGKSCRVCGGTIQRILLGQRGTHFCPNCQPGPERNPDQ